MAEPLDETYAVGSGPVHLDVLVGDAQVGQTLVKLDDVEVGIGDIVNLPVGDGLDLIGRSIVVQSWVTDINPHTNRITLRYILRGGAEEHIVDQVAFVPEEGDSIILEATFHFIA
jgi:hypothetical protein